MNVKKLVIAALFIALSFVGAQIKIMGSIAFDSMAGFLGTLMLGPVFGAIIGAIGHFLTAATTGFYLTLPVHFIIMVDMAFTMIFFGLIYKALKNVSKLTAYIVSGVAAVVINGPVSLVMLIPMLGKGIFAMAPILSLAAAANVIIAIAIYKFLPDSLKLWK